MSRITTEQDAAAAAAKEEKLLSEIKTTRAQYLEAATQGQDKTSMNKLRGDLVSLLSLRYHGGRGRRMGNPTKDYVTDRQEP